MSKNGLIDKEGAAYLYNEIASGTSASFGISHLGEVRISVSPTAGVSPDSGNARITFDPTLDGNITISPAGGNVLIDTGDFNVELGSVIAADGLQVEAFGVGVLTSDSSGNISSINGTNGQVIIGSTAGSPAWASITAGTNISITPGSNTLTIGSTVTPGISWTEITTTTVSLSVNAGYILNNASLVTATLPTTASVGAVINIVGKGTGGWKIAQSAGQIIHFGILDSTLGITGSLASTLRYDCVELICIIANTDFLVRGSIGNITVV